MRKLKSINPVFIFISCLVILNVIFISRIYSKELEKKDIVRLHVVANSDFEEDQIVKLKVYEKVNSYLDTKIPSDLDKKSEVIKIIKSNIPEILDIANTTLKENNMGYTAKVKIGKITYDEKQSIDLDMEKGVYDSIQIILGDAKGKNFWSCIFPNKENIQKLKGYESILPGISNIYEEKENQTNKEEITYTFKLFDILKDMRAL